MKILKNLRVTLLLISWLIPCLAEAQPIPVEWTMGNTYGTVNVVLFKSFTRESKFGFFHMNTVQFNYTDHNQNDFIMQDLAYAEIIKNLRITGGVIYSAGGFNTTAGMQYVYAGEKLLFLLAPRINIEPVPCWDVMTIVQYKPSLNEHTKLYTRLQLLNLFDHYGNIKSYQWMRLGLEIHGVQFGLAFNLDESGPHPSAKTNLGVFVRKEIF